MKKIFCAIGVGSCLLLAGCTEPGETTGIGAATGGVLGAGLGAIIGNQTGDPGAGIAVGAAAGAAAGAAVGNALQAQQEAIRTQDEALERQENLIRAQNRELEELRRGYGQDNQRAAYRQPSRDMRQAPAYQPSSRAALGTMAPISAAPISAAPIPVSADRTLEDRPLKSRDITSVSESLTASTAPSAASSGMPALTRPVEAAPARVASPAKPMSAECRDAQAEVDKAGQSGETPERLFHYRRALRLCPDEASFHNGLGELYLSMNRKSDAEFEFREALRLDPTQPRPRENLSLLQK